LILVELLGENGQRVVESRSSAQAVDRLEASCRDEPCPRIGRQSLIRPLFHGSSKSLVHGILGQVKITEQTDQGSKDASRLCPVNGIHLGANLFASMFVRQFKSSNMQSVRTLCFVVDEWGLMADFTMKQVWIYHDKKIIISRFRYTSIIVISSHRE
jgi:hypothetical protein